MMGILIHKNSLKGGNPARKRFVYRLFIFFTMGFLLGLSSPFINIFKDLYYRHSSSFFLEIRDDDGETLDVVSRKQLIVVTPAACNRGLEGIFLDRLGQTLGLVPPPLLWIVVEMDSASMEMARVLRSSGVMYRHLVCHHHVKDGGLEKMRNAALDHIKLHKLDGIVYFAECGNVYSLELFERLRDIRHIGTWPVATFDQNKNKVVLEGPVCNGNQVIGWQTNERSKKIRNLHVRLSGLAFNSTILWNLKRTRDPSRQLDTVVEFQIVKFVERLVKDESQMEGIPESCSRVMNWQLDLEAHNLNYPRSRLVTST